VPAPSRAHRTRAAARPRPRRCHVWGWVRIAARGGWVGVKRRSAPRRSAAAQGSEPGRGTRAAVRSRPRADANGPGGSCRPAPSSRDRGHAASPRARDARR
jgi:hypothetical protein